MHNWLSTGITFAFVSSSSSLLGYTALLLLSLLNNIKI
jgi:hypothetical protein